MAASVMGQEKSAPTLERPAVEPPVPDAPAPMTDIHDILPPVFVGFDSTWLVPALIGLAVVLFMGAVWWLWRRYKKNTVVETVVPELPPELVARQGLDEIGDVRGWDGKTFYFRLSAILRQYVLGRFSVGAPEMTTEEFLPCIDRLPIDSDLAVRLRQLCRAMDPVKFGGASVMEKQMEADLFFAREFVRKTTLMDDVESHHDGGEQEKSLKNNEGNPKFQISNIK